MNKLNANKVYRLISGILLILLAILSLGGGGMLIYDPSGASMQFPISLLDNTPFNNYLVPGIILFTVLGLFSIYIIAGILSKNNKYVSLIAWQGVVLLIWLGVELLLNPNFYYPIMHIPLTVMAFMLIIIGTKLKHSKNIENPKIN